MEAEGGGVEVQVGVEEGKGSWREADQGGGTGGGRACQIVEPFPEMTVAENVAAAAMFAGAVRYGREAEAEALEHLRFVGLAEMADKRAASLTLAMRKRLELAKGLAMHPKLLLLDEVNAGLNATEVDHALALIRGIAARGVTILIIEHLMKVVLSLCTRIVVLHHGELIASGAPETIVKDPRVIQAYLGRRYATGGQAANG